ncbi:oocyte-expressed protein homolog [Sorex araneus]|uniref:oocyte-expressed protein homolog n=1 Tax=Sorex araneus TaxID=42254 RepID=UPI0003315835|nr:oocyte-expressed protein homolog [Sorex araneus]
MCDQTAAVGAAGSTGMPAPTLHGLQEESLPPLPIHVRPWWFPVEELRNPLVFYLEAWVADIIFGADRTHIPQMQWLGQVLLTVNVLKQRDLVEIAVFGRPCQQSRMKRVLLSLASWHRQHRNRAEKMQRLEDSLKGPLLDPDFA